MEQIGIDPPEASDKLEGGRGLEVRHVRRLRLELGRRPRSRLQLCRSTRPISASAERRLLLEPRSRRAHQEQRREFDRTRAGTSLYEFERIHYEDLSGDRDRRPDNQADTDLRWRDGSTRRRRGGAPIFAWRVDSYMNLKLVSRPARRRPTRAGCRRPTPWNRRARTHGDRCSVVITVVAARRTRRPGPSFPGDRRWWRYSAGTSSGTCCTPSAPCCSCWRSTSCCSKRRR